MSTTLHTIIGLQVLGQKEIDDCWDFLKEIGVTLTTTVNGSVPVTVAATTVAPTDAPTTQPGNAEQSFLSAHVSLTHKHLLTLKIQV